MLNKTIPELHASLMQKEFSATELTKYFLDRIKTYQPELNAFITITENHALKQAKAADEKIQAGEAQILTGIPIGQKDIFCTDGIRTSCASRMLDNFIAPYNATVIEKCNAAGMVMLGKLNMDEFAMGSSNENSFYGPVKNPWDLDKTPGGSSGGSAAAMAARLCPIVTGTDTGGSIRQPAALCGITGIKPTYGRVSRYGMIAFASSFDQAGPMAQSAEDCAILLNAMAGHDPKDSTSSLQNSPDFTAGLTTDVRQDLKGITIGIPKQYFGAGIKPRMERALDDARAELEKCGAKFVDISLPHTNVATAAYYVLAPAEASANLARFDGLRYGYSCKQPTSLEDLYCRSRSEGFGDEVKRRIMIGNFVLSSGFHDAYYKKAQCMRRLIKNDFTEAFKTVDAIFAPVTPTPAFNLNDNRKDLVATYMSDVFTIAANMAGLPAMSVPAGFIDDLPVGIQLIGQAFDEAKILQIAHQYQLKTDWHKQVPKGFGDEL